MCQYWFVRAAGVFSTKDMMDMTTDMHNKSMEVAEGAERAYHSVKENTVVKDAAEGVQDAAQATADEAGKLASTWTKINLDIDGVEQ